MSLTIFAVDDSRTMRDMLRIALTEAGFEVHLAEDGEDGLEKLADLSPDVIITDITCQSLTALALSKALVAAKPIAAYPFSF